MKKSVILVLILAFLAVFMLHLVSAEVIVSQPNPIYNIGDKFSVQATVSPMIDPDETFVIGITCEGRETEIYRGPTMEYDNISGRVNLNINLVQKRIGDLKGSCYVSVAYGNESGNSTGFAITNEIDPVAVINGIVFDPEQTVNISGAAIKKNGNKFNGFAEIIISNMSLDLIAEITDGNFATSFAIPPTTPSGEYNAAVSVYEKDSSGAVINEGNTSVALKVNQVIKKIAIALNKQSITPGEDLKYTVVLEDQASMNVNGEDVPITISTPDGTDLVKDVIKSGEEKTQKIETNASAGYWKLSSSYEGLVVEKLAYVDELKKVSYLLENNTLTITNVGNVLYDKPVKITIGETSDVKEIKLDVGESIKYSLYGNGSYIIKAGDDSGLSEVGTSALTGNAVGVGAYNPAGATLSWGIIIWIIVIVILALVVFYYYRKIRNRTFRASAPAAVINMVGTKMGMKKESGNIIDSGERQQCAVVALRVKNSAEVGNSELSKGVLDSALAKAKELGAKVYSTNDYRLMIFAPMLTKEQENSMRAIRTAKEIESMIIEYNKVHTPAINFGIGVNNGDLAVEKRGEEVKFASLGNTISLAKRVAEISDKDVSLSDLTHRKVLGAVKSEKVQGGFWKVRSVSSREKNNEFIERFLDRQRKR